MNRKALSRARVPGKSVTRPIQASIPSVDRVLRLAPVAALVADHGRDAVVSAVRAEVDGLRAP